MNTEAMLPPWLRELVDMKATADSAYVDWMKGRGTLEAYSAKMGPFVEMLRGASDWLLKAAIRDALGDHAKGPRNPPAPDSAVSLAACAAAAQTDRTVAVLAETLGERTCELHAQRVLTQQAETQANLLREQRDSLRRIMRLAACRLEAPHRLDSKAIGEITAMLRAPIPPADGEARS